MPAYPVRNEKVIGAAYTDPQGLPRERGETALVCGWNDKRKKTGGRTARLQR